MRTISKASRLQKLLMCWWGHCYGTIEIDTDKCFYSHCRGIVANDNHGTQWRCNRCGIIRR